MHGPCTPAWFRREVPAATADTSGKRLRTSAADSDGPSLDPQTVS